MQRLKVQPIFDRGGMLSENFCRIDEALNAISEASCLLSELPIHARGVPCLRGGLTKSRIPSPRRAAATLVEVLVSIFVMSIGMICLLTLFPIGTMRMAQAVQDEGTSRAAYNAGNIANMPLGTGHRAVRAEPFYTAPTSALAPNTNSFDPFVKYFPSGGPLSPAINGDGPSYPVFCDPLGWQASSHSDGDYVAGIPWKSSPIRRVVPSFTVTAGGVDRAKAYKWFSLLDDLSFDASSYISSPANRDITISWAYLLQRPRAKDTSIVNCTVVMYNHRALTSNLPEWCYDASVQGSGNPTFYVPSSNSIILNYTNYTAPPLRPGDWILDATTSSPSVGNLPHGNFYRVVGLNESGNFQLACEVEKPLRGFTPIATTVVSSSNGVPLPTGTINVASTAGFPSVGSIAVQTTTGLTIVNYTGMSGASFTGCTGGLGTMTTGSDVGAAYTGTAIVMEGVVETFERGVGWHP